MKNLGLHLSVPFVVSLLPSFTIATQHTAFEKRTGAGNTFFNDFPTSANITWTDCQLPGRPLVVQCARLLVPLDYTDPDDTRTISIALTKLPSLIPESDPNWKGPLFVNYGGPGVVSTFRSLLFGAEEIQTITGGNYSIIHFDPRGVGFSEPNTNCHGEDSYRSFAYEQTFLTRYPRSIELGGLQTAREWYSGHKSFGELCMKNLGGRNGTARYVGTAAVARDVVRISDAIWASEGREGDVNFFGISYGTTIGQTIATMFPQRVGNFLLDSAMDTATFFDYDKTVKEKIQDVEKGLESFYKYCAIGICALNDKKTLSAAQIKRRVERILAQVKESDIISPDDQSFMTYQHIHMALYNALYDPLGTFPFVAEELLKAERGYYDINSLASIFQFWLGSKTDLSGVCIAFEGTPIQGPFGSQTDAMHLINCGDLVGKFGKRGNAQDLLEVYNSALKTSVTGAHSQILNWLRCIGFDESERAVERLTAYGAKPKNPILFTGNARDPVTPIKFAYEGAKLFPGSVAFEQDATGHSISSAPSLCGSRIVSDFFISGKLPKHKTVCKPDELPFEKVSDWHEIFLPDDPEDSSARVATFSVEEEDKSEVIAEVSDEQLMKATRNLGKSLRVSGFLRPNGMPPLNPAKVEEILARRNV